MKEDLKSIVKQIPDDIESFMRQAMTEDGGWWEVELEGQLVDMNFYMPDDNTMKVVGYPVYLDERDEKQTNTNVQLLNITISGFGKGHYRAWQDGYLGDRSVVLCQGCLALSCGHAQAIFKTYIEKPTCACCGL